MSGFTHSVAGGDGVLIVDALQSPNYSPGAATGWSINQDGSATFNSVSLPGIAVGSAVTFASTAPTAPAVGDVWYDTGNGLLAQQWNGTEWVPYQIGTPAIANGAITSDQIATGTVVAGIVNATTISAATLEGGTISGAEIEGGTFNGGTFSGGTIDGGTINAGTINGSDINVNSDAGITVYNDSDETIGTWNSSGLDTTSISINGITGTASLECDSGHFADNVVIGGTISASNYTSGQGTPTTYPLSTGGAVSNATFAETINAMIQALQDAGIMTT